MIRAFSAPGKLFVAGEYGVLWGGTARVCAVGPRSHSAAIQRRDRVVELLFPHGALRGQSTRLGVNWERAPVESERFAARAADLAYAALGRDAPGVALALGPSPVGPAGQKLGLGGSARTVALVAESVRSCLEAKFDALKVALLAHWDAQGQRGSGADVAAIVVGGLVSYQRYAVEGLFDAFTRGEFASALRDAPPVSLRRLGPLRLASSWIWSGRAASTPGLVAQAEGALSPASRLQFGSRSDELGAQLELAFERREAARAIEVTSALDALLREIPGTATEALDQIRAAVASFGGASKPSGAGGGDGAWAVFPSAEAQAAVHATLAHRGFYCVAVEPDVGLRGEPLADPTLSAWLDTQG